MITEQWIRQLIKEDKLYKFYKTKQWLDLKQSILNKFRNECQECLKLGKYSQARNVHHINEVKNRPDLALKEYYIDSSTGETKRNLIPLCIDCHNKAHGRMCGNEHKKQLNEERW